MNRNTRRLDRLEGWGIERMWAHIELQTRRAGAVQQDEEWQRLVDALNTLCDAVPQPPPATYRLHPRAVLFQARKHGITPDEYRQGLWAQQVVAGTPAGRELYRQLQAIEARYRGADDERTDP